MTGSFRKDRIRLELQGTPPVTPASGEGVIYIGDDGTFYLMLDDGTPVALGGGGGGAESYALCADLKAKGTSGGTSTNTTTHTRALAEVTDDDNILSVSSNVITLAAAGTYRVRFSAPCYQGGLHHAYLWNDTDSALAANGASEVCGTADTTQTRSWGGGIITIAASKTFTLRHYINTGLATNGLGFNTNINDVGANALQELYSFVEFWKLP